MPMTRCVHARRPRHTARRAAARGVHLGILEPMDAHCSTTRAEPHTRLGPPARPEVLALFGPTAVGKTAIAGALAELRARRGAPPVALAADAVQLYRGLGALAGTPSPA